MEPEHAHKPAPILEPDAMVDEGQRRTTLQMGSALIAAYDDMRNLCVVVFDATYQDAIARNHTHEAATTNAELAVKTALGKMVDRIMADRERDQQHTKGKGI